VAEVVLLWTDARESTGAVALSNLLATTLPAFPAAPVMMIFGLNMLVSFKRLGPAGRNREGSHCAFSEPSNARSGIRGPTGMYW